MSERDIHGWLAVICFIIMFFSFIAEFTNGIILFGVLGLMNWITLNGNLADDSK